MIAQFANSILFEIQNFSFKEMHFNMLFVEWLGPQCATLFALTLHMTLLYWYWNIALKNYYSKTSNISRTLVGNKIVDISDVIGASPVGAAPTTSSFST